MNIITNVFKSSLGKKYIMAVTGCCLFLFVIGHMVGNLQIFLGREAINRYGHFLQSNPELIWPVRLGLLVVLVLHIWSAIVVSLENKAARPVGYDAYKPIGSSYASRTMLMGGIIVFVFIVYHLLHYTAQVQHLNFTHQNFAAFMEKLPGQFPPERHDIYRMMVVGFSKPLVSGFYLLGLALLSLHLSHGASSMFQSLGWKNETYRPFFDRAARVVAWLIFLGYSSIPIAVLCGFGKEALK
ncbi:MAG TPA: succinate dehydrogenase cytochrome b subunit [Candidatus Paceibacterota bacterium]|nr:succinate dehydrogenase cytochrome b subunit [Verrucomicrobiota bacterium]HSA12535.1 succinate dehydrogenase cytochrome b subunit [Candidatus Paceibacterota bacterium]